MSENELRIEVPNLLQYDSLASLKSAIENYKNIIITSICFIIDQNNQPQLYSCENDSEFLSYKSYLDQQSSDSGNFLITYIPNQPLDLEILSISGTPDLAYIKPNTLFSKTWILKSKFSFKLVCIEGELEGVEIVPDLIGDDVYRAEVSIKAEGLPRLVNLYFKAKYSDSYVFGPMLWVSLVII